MLRAAEERELANSWLVGLQAGLAGVMVDGLESSFGRVVKVYAVN